MGWKLGNGISGGTRKLSIHDIWEIRIKKQEQELCEEEVIITKVLNMCLLEIQVCSDVFPNVQTSVANEENLDGDCVIKAGACDSRSVPMSTIIDVENEWGKEMKTEEIMHIDLVSDEEPISKCLAPSIAKSLKSRRGKMFILK
ncbi:hypothetical protein RYX36_010207, partial [Vicia faba]